MRAATLFTALVLFALSAASSLAIPPEVAVTGFLTEDNGAGELVPVTGDFPLRLSFLVTAASKTALCEVTTTAQVREGILNATIRLPEELLVLEEVWYKVAIDRDKNGFGSNDAFGEAVRLTSVPYALSAQPLEYFESHGGQGGSNQFGAQTSVNTPGKIFLAPFSSPPGGVRFNRIATGIGLDTSAITSFGVYDDKGSLLFSSPPLTGNQLSGLLAVEVEGRLQPSRIYYTAYITNGARTPAIGIIMLPNIPTRGTLIGPTRDGTLPAKIDINQIAFSSDYRPISISFYLVGQAASKLQKFSLGKGKAYVPGK